MVSVTLAVKTPIFLVSSHCKRFRCLKQLVQCVCVWMIFCLAEMLAGIFHLIPLKASNWDTTCLYIWHLTSIKYKLSWHFSFLHSSVFRNSSCVGARWGSNQADSNHANNSYSVLTDILDMFIWPRAPRSRKRKSCWLYCSPASTILRPLAAEAAEFYDAVSEASLFGSIQAFYLLLRT